MFDALAITRGLALTDVGLAQAGLSREERLPIWRASLNAMAASERDLGLGGWLIPGALLWVASLREGDVLCELGWPELPAGPSMMRVPLRRFGSMAWALDGGSWAPAWWSRVQRPASPVEWDRRLDERSVAEEIAVDFAGVWQRSTWLALSWRQAIPGWVDRIFCANHEAMKRGLLAALRLPRTTVDLSFVPVLAGGSQLARVSVAALEDPKTALLSPSEAGYRAFLENVRGQGVAKNLAMSMAWSWWGRHLDGGVVP